MSFNLTTNPGVLSGHWPVTKDVLFPDTIAAFGKPDIAGKPYRWALEFQCVEEYKSIIFVGINFYARDRLGSEAERSYNEMLSAA